MSTNELIERALEQARSIQKTIGEAANKNAEQMKPLLEQSVKTAQELQVTLGKHASESATIAQEHAKLALGYLQEYVKIGGEAARASAQQAQDLTQKMVEQGRAAVEQTMASVGKNTGDGSSNRK